MAFTNPATSATGVDTADDDLSWPGVRLFQENAGNLATARGVAEWRVGSAVIPEAVAARGEIVPQLVTSGGIDRAARWRLRGPGVSDPPLTALTGALLELAAERDATTGTWASRATLTVDALTVNGPGIAGSPLPITGTLASSGTRYIEISSFRTGWAQWTTAGYAKLSFTRTPDGMIEVAGTVLYNGGTGAAVDVCNLTGAYVPKYGHVQLSANVQDTFRFVEARTDGTLRLRGALPTAGQFVAISGRYQGQEF